MIYEHRTYNILPGKMAQYVDVFGNLFHLFEKHGAKVIGVWQTAIGQNNEFIYILCFEDLGHQERFWQSFRQDEEFKRYQQDEPRVAYVVSKILQPTPYSPLQ